MTTQPSPLRVTRRALQADAKQERRTRILDAAEQVLLHSLNRDISMADVAQAASAPAAAAGAGNLRIDTGSAGEPRLVTGDNFDRAWRRIGLAIDKSGLSPQDQNRDNGVYVVQYSADKVKDPSPSPGSVKGFLGTLSSVGKSIWSRITDTDTSSPDKPVVIKGDGFVAGGPDLSAVKIPDGTYRLALSHEGDAPTHITVLDKDGQAPDPGVARKLLNVIAAQLR